MNFLNRSTLQLLRFHFSFFLMPVYFFALTQIVSVNVLKAVGVFFILHFLVYPSSNGYNSYMDRDESPIGGIKNPLQPTRQLYVITIIMDVMAVVLSLLVSPFFSLGVLLYILASKAYSYRGLRLKKYPIAGYLTVMLFQGGLVFLLVYVACNRSQQIHFPALPIIASSLLIGGFYPLTQIYQHVSDKKDGVNTLSMLLGYRGTFLFTGIVYVLAFMFLAIIFFFNLEWNQFFLLQIFMLPVFVYYFIWFRKVWKDVTMANYSNTMRMNLLASVCSNLGFVSILIYNI